MFILKGCRRCGGDLHADAEGEIVCIQCGHELSPDQAAAVQAQIARAIAARRAPAPEHRPAKAA
jgi:uncharacterized membrane protein YvbJ